MKTRSGMGAQSTKLSPRDLPLRTSHRETNKQPFEKGLPLVWGPELEEFKLKSSFSFSQ